MKKIIFTIISSLILISACSPSADEIAKAMVKAEAEAREEARAKAEAQSEKANASLAEIQLRSLKGNCEAYRLYFKKSPDKLDDLINTPDGRNIISEVPLDPWGNSFIFNKTGNKISLSSPGADGIPGNADDIVVHVNM